MFPSDSKTMQVQQSTQLIPNQFNANNKRKADIDNNNNVSSTQAKKTKTTQVSVNNYKGLPMFKCPSRMVAPADKSTSVLCRRIHELNISFTTPKQFGPCFFMNPVCTVNTGMVGQKPNDRLTIETLGGLNTFGFRERSTYHIEGTPIKSTITLIIPHHSQTYQTLQMFDAKCEKAFNDFMLTWQKKNTKLEYVPLLRVKDGNNDTKFSTLKLDIPRNRKTTDILVQTSELKSDGSNINVPITNVTAGSEIRVLFKWTGFKIISATSKVYHNVSALKVQLTKVKPVCDFSSNYDPTEAAP